MESTELFPKINISNLSSKLENDSIYIPIKTIKNYIFPDKIKDFTLYDYNFNKIDANFKSDFLYIISIIKFL